MTGSAAGMRLVCSMGCTPEPRGGDITVPVAGHGPAERGIPIGMRHLLPGVMRRRKGYRRIRVFRDPDVQADLARDGYHVTGPVVGPERIARLRVACADWQEMRPPPTDGRFHFSGERPPTAASAFARARIDEVLVPAIVQLVDPVTARVGPAVFQVKPSSPNSGIRSHQDPFIVDEQRSFSVAAWTALTDVTIESGALIVLPGSHRYGNWKRVATTTDDLDGFHQVIERHARAILLRPGQVLLFDNALIHGSLVNRSGLTRLGASAVIVPRESDLTIPVPVDGPSPASIDLYRMEVDRATGAIPPTLTDGEHLGRIRLAALEVGPRGLDAVCRLQAALYPGGPGIRIPRGISTA